MMCILNGREVLYPCSCNCPLYGDCVVAFDAEKKPNPQTNADRIRAMSDEELMHLLFVKVSCGSVCSFCVPKKRKNGTCDGHCRNGVLEWLKQPVKDGED